MEFGVLGPLEVRASGQVVDIGSRMPRLLLAALLLEPGAVVSLDGLIDALWGEAPPPGAIGALQVHVSALRRALEPDRAPRAAPTVLVRRAPGYALLVERGAVDAHRFARLIGAGRARLAAGEPSDAVAALRNALALWRGTPYADLAGAAFLQPEAVRLTELRAGAWESLAEAGLAAGEHASLVADLERLAHDEPIRERRWELLALALYRSGRQTEALRVLQQARRTLIQDMGIEPGPSLRRLEQDILQQAPSLEWRPPSTRASATAIGERAAASRTSGPPLVGRDTELAQLRTALDGTVNGHGRVALISGEPGIGKTRLAEELSASAASRGVQVAWGRAPEGDAAPAYWPWVQIVRTLVTESAAEALRQALAADAEELVRLVPEVTEVAGRELGRPLDVASDTARTRLYDAVVGFVLRLAASRPLLLVIDDMHWADVQTLQLVQLLAGRLSAAPVLLAATYRVHDTGATGAVLATLASLARVPGLLRVQPHGLTEPDVRRLAAHATGRELSAEVTEIIWARTEGNPFFVTELLQLLQAQGQLSDPHGDSIRREIPRGVRDVIRQRLARLSEPARSLLATAAVAGRTFEADVVAAAAGVDEDRALELVESALSVGVVVEHPSVLGLYRFSHSLVRQTIYAGLSAQRRARLHRTVGLVLVRIAGDDENRAAEIADHFFAAGPDAGEGDEAYTWAIRAADRAAIALAFEQSEALLTRAMELARQRKPEHEALRRELAAQRRLAGVRLMRHWYSAPEVGEAWAGAVELARRVESSPDVLATMWGAWCYHYIRGDLARALEQAEEMERRARTADDLVLDVVGRHCAGITCFHLGQLRQSVERLAGVEERIERAPGDLYAGPVFEPDVRLGHRLFRGLAACLMAGPEGLVTLDRGLEEARHHGAPMGVVEALILGVVGRAVDGDRTGAEPLAAEGVALSEQHGFRLFGAMMATLLGWSQADAGSMRAGLDAVQETGSRLLLPLFWGLLADVERHQGRYADAIAGVRRAIGLAGATGERFWAPELHRLHGQLLSEGEPAQPTEAEEALRTGLVLAAEQGAAVLERRLAECLHQVIPC